MKCHYIYDQKVGKVLIPGCWGTAIHYPDMKHCTCRPELEKTFEAFEKALYKQNLRGLKDKSNELEKEVHRLNRIIRKLLKSK